MTGKLHIHRCQLHCAFYFVFIRCQMHHNRTILRQFADGNVCLGAAMETLKIRIEIGDRKFEADGPANVVTLHANAFMKFTVGGNAETIAAEAAANVKAIEAAARAKEQNEKALRLDTIMRVDGATVALNILPKQSRDALLALMLGHRELRNNHVVSGGDIIRGLRASGRRMVRADHVLKSCARYKYLTSTGKYRGRRYQLTETGVQRAEAVASLLIATLPKARDAG